MLVDGLQEYSKKLKENRMSINDKFIEIRDLEDEKRDLWKKLLKECNDNKISFKKQGGLDGLDAFRLEENINASDSYDYQLIMDCSTYVSATGLAVIEVETGLTYQTNIDKSYVFILK